VAETGERISDEVVVERTGKTREEWFALLDEWGGAERSHGEIARHLSGEHGVTGWWAQNVTVAYERARGLRDHGQNAAGYSASASKTVGVPVERLYAALIEERERWAPDAPLAVRTATEPRSARFDWEDGTTRVNAWLEPKADDRSTLALEHERLPDAGEAERMRGFWRERLGHLKTYLEE
jgi:uncharacterized protein DUF4287